MKISIKLLLGFTAIIALLIIVLFISGISTTEISEYGNAVVSQIENSEGELSLFKEYEKLDISVEKLVQNVLSLGYVSTLEDSNRLKEEFNSQISTLYSQVSDNSDYTAALKTIEDEVMNVFLMKEMEIESTLETKKIQEIQNGLFEERKTLNAQIIQCQSVNEEKVKKFLEEFTAVKANFEGLKKPTEEQKHEISDALDQTTLNTLSLFEIEEVWKPVNLGITVKEFASIQSLIRNILLNPRSAAVLSEEINAIAQKIKSNIDFQVKFGSSVYDPVSSQLITMSLDYYIEKLKKTVVFIDKVEKINIESSDLQADIDSSRALYEEAKTQAFDLLTESVMLRTNQLRETIAESVDQQYSRLEDSFSSIKSSNANSLSITQKNNTLILLLILSSVILSVVIAVIVFLSIRFAIKRLMNKANILKELDLTLDFNDGSKNDEIGNIENTFSDIILTMRETITAFKGAVHEVNKVTEELETVAIESQKISSDLKNQAVETDNEVHDTSAAIEEVSSGIEEVAASARNVSDVSTTLFEKTKDTSNSAKAGQVVLNKVANIVSEAETHAEESIVIVNELQKKAKNVGEIVEVISSISEQTNLLALNAAIEAARAGEAGKGFAVVADEIRKLAEESQKSTHDIEQMLKEIGNGVVEVDSASRKTVEIVNDMNTNSHSALEQFEKILENLSAVNDSVANLNETSDMQSAAADEIATAMDKSAQSMIKASEKVQDMVKHVERQNISIEKLTETADKLLQLDKVIEGDISKFKL